MSTSFLQLVSTLALYGAAIFGGIALIASLVGGVAGATASARLERASAEKIAAANAQAEAARLETERLRSHLQARRLTKSQLRTLLDRLEKKPELRFIVETTHDPEAMDYWDDFIEGFRGTDFVFSPNTAWRNVSGVHLLGPEGPDKRYLAESLAQAEIEFVYGGERPAGPEGAIGLLIGSRPPLRP